MDALRVLLVDDHVLFRKGLMALLSSQSDFNVVGEAENGLEALAQARTLMPDLILMDVAMPVCDGLEATRRIVTELPYVKIVVLTVAEDDRSLFEAIKSGAHGYLLKKLEPGQLFEMLRGVSCGEAPISRFMAGKLIREFSRLGENAHAKAGIQRLTDREREVLQFVAHGSTNKEIADKLVIAENTVKNHLKNILAKLHLENRVQAAAYAIQQGLTTASH
ncbi:MAG: response regulator transcription factor [Ardenticatenaceae bacterium]|nr:response regulator transcription factor [Ardenticatenaceae bacterium]HBY97675.1 DNA-binding response regulator [Chloroflexota bacterium]